MRTVLPALALTALALAATACDDTAEDGFAIDPSGAVGGLVWLDRNGNGVLDGNDGPVRDIDVDLVPRSGGAVAYSGTSDATGAFLIEDVLPGDYEAVVNRETLGDTLRVQPSDSSTVTVPANDTAVVLVGLSFPALTVDSARGAPVDTRVTVEGLVLTRWNVFADQTLHVRDSTGAIRGVRVAPTGVVPGDSVRLLGSISLQAGQPVLKDVAVFLLQTGLESPAPDTVATAVAASAAGGALDAGLVHLESAVVQDTARNVNGDLVVTVTDGSGPVDVLLDRDVAWRIVFEGGVIGSTLDVTGVLVPLSAGAAWVVKPREGADVEAGPAPASP